MVIILICELDWHKLCTGLDYEKSARRNQKEYQIHPDYIDRSRVDLSCAGFDLDWLQAPERGF
jgi:hypothetical protein